MSQPSKPRGISVSARIAPIQAIPMTRKRYLAVRSHLLERLNPIGSASYQGEHRCMQGTRTMILDDITTWAIKTFDRDTPAHCPNTDNIFWLYGMPGLGKTSVANSLCHLLHNKRSLGGSFFCRRDDPILREPKRVLPTLIYRLAGMWSPYATLVAQALRDDPTLVGFNARRASVKAFTIVAKAPNSHLGADRRRPRRVRRT